MLVNPDLEVVWLSVAIYGRPMTEVFGGFDGKWREMGRFRSGRKGRFVEGAEQDARNTKAV